MLWSLLALVALGGSLVLSEAFLRSQGVQPGRDVFPREPVMMEPDPVLGWRNRPGHYVYPGYSADVESIAVTIWPDGSRATRASQDEAQEGAKDSVVLLGDSLTMGWAVSDEETFAWQLQERLPGLDVRNHGVAGYGTYQSLLLMRKLLAEGQRPRLILYGFINDHEHRNVADYRWLRALTVRSSMLRLSVPYALLGRDETLEEHAPAPSPVWPLRSWLSSAVALEDLQVRTMTAGRFDHAERVTELLLGEMDREARSHGARFAVVFLMGAADRLRHFREYLTWHGISLIDCDRPLLPTMVVRGEGHPNRLMHEQWAACMAEGLHREWPENAALVEVSPAR